MVETIKALIEDLQARKKSSRARALSPLYRNSLGTRVFSPNWRNAMAEPLSLLIESSIQIAWDYLERTGELGEPEVASRFLLETVELMIRHGERRRLLLSNKAIDAYRRFNNERKHLAMVS
jgi:hypothetical protein